MTLSVVFFGAIHKVGFDWVQFDNETAPYVGFGSMSGLTFTASQRYLQFDEMVAGYTAVMEIDGPPDLPDGHIDFTLTIDSLPGAEPSTGAVSLDYPSDRSPVFDSWNNDALLNSSSIEFNDRAGCGSAPPVTTIVTGSDQTANFPMYVRVEYTVVAHVFEDCSVNGNPDSESGVLGYIVTVDKVEWVADGSGDRTTLYSSLTADFSGTPLAGGAPLSVAFTDASTGSPTSWLWDFGDGNTSTDQNPTHVYTADGVYTVALTATNIDGSDTETKVDYITVASPVADFSGTPTSGTVALSVDFTDLSTNVPTSWFWDFGDGGSSTSQNPTYVYNYIGTYTVTLTATNGSGSDSETKVAYITVTAVVEYGAAMIENCDIDTGGAAVGLRVADVAIARDNRFGSVTVDASAELRAKDNSYTTLVNNGTLQPLAGDRAVFDALNYQARHTNDVDAGIHWTQTELDSRYLMWFNVTDYGATGDGTTDDAAAFNATIAACGSAGGGTIYIPYTANHYRLASAVTLDTHHRTTIYFEDGAVVKQDAGVTALLVHQGIESGGVYVARGREVTILNPQIDGNSGAGTIGIEIRDSDRVAIHHPNIWKNDVGVWFHAVEGSGFGQCEGCEISGTGTIAGTGADSDIKFTMEAGSNGSFMETYIRDVEFTSGANGGIYIGPGCLLYRCFIMGTCWPALSQIVFHVAGTLIGSWLHIAIDYLNQAATTITILKVASTAVGTENDWWKFDIVGATGGTVGIWDIASGKHLRLQQNGPDNYLDATSFVTVNKIAQTYPQIELGVDGTSGGRINFGSGTGATDGTLERRGAGWLGASVPFGLKTYTTAGRPSAASREGALIYDSDLNIVLQSDGSNWIPVSGALALNDLTDVDITGSGTGDVIYNNAGTWEDYPLGIGSRVTVSGTKIRFGNVAGGNYLEIDSVTGTLRLVGDATTYDDFRVEASVIKPGATAPSWKAFGPSGNLQALMFEASHDDEAYFELQMPHTWKLGTNLYPHVHWTPTDATAGNVVWELEYAWANIGDAYGAPSTMATDPTAAGGVAWVHKLTDFKSGGNNYIDGTGKTLSSMLVCRVHRNSNSGSDTLNKDVALLEIDFHYQIDSLGSDEPLVKDASASLLLETGDILLLETGDRLLTE